MNKKLKAIFCVALTAAVLSSGVFTKANMVQAAETTKTTDNSSIKVKASGDGSFKAVSSSDRDSKELSKYDQDVYVSKSDMKKFLKVNDNTFLEVNEVSINPYDKNAVEDIIKKYEIKDNAASDLRDYANKCADGTVKNAPNIIYYTPKTLISSTAVLPLINSIHPLASSGTLVSTKTYSGYGGKTYYEELFNYQNGTGYQTVKESNNKLNDYIDKVITEKVTDIAGGVVKEVIGDTFTLIQLAGGYIDTSPIAPNSNWMHQANLHENKYKKYCYVKEYNYSTGKYDYLIGADGETVNYYFQHQITDGYNYIPPVTDAVKVDTTPYYLNLDSKAYYFYLNTGGPYIERTANYTVDGKLFNSI